MSEAETRTSHPRPSCHRFDVDLELRKTLGLVARYADARNLFDTPDLPRPLVALRAHCDAINRDYDEIEKTVVMPLDPGPGGRKIDNLVNRLREFETLGIES